MRLKEEKDPRTREQRKEHGLKQREIVDRIDHEQWAARSDRQSPVDMIMETCENRIPNLFAVRIARMAASPFTFFRGSAFTMAADLATLPHTGIITQLSGDAHVLNLSAFAAPDGHLLFDFYDFDETYPGPFEWDLKRLAASIIIAGRDAGDKPENSEHAVKTMVKAYRHAMAKFAEMSVIDLSRVEVRRKTKSKPIREIIGKAESKTVKVLLQKITAVSDTGDRKLIDQPEKVFHISKEEAQPVLNSFEEYRNSLPPDRQKMFDVYTPVDIAFRVGGIGSVGTRVYVVLFIGRDPSDALFLQVKEEESSCLEPFVPTKLEIDHEGKRVVEGQRIMQSQGDPFLGWTTIHGNPYMVRQLKDHKKGVDPTILNGETLVEYSFMCGEILAKAHARGGDSAEISGYCGNDHVLDDALARFAVLYADQNAKDHKELLKAIDDGKVPSNPKVEPH